jgi:hypothetical protein
MCAPLPAELLLHDLDERVNSVSINGMAVMSDIQYQPFGPIKSWKDRKNNLVSPPRSQ